MSGFLNSRKASGSKQWTAPTDDLYGVWGKNSGGGMFDKIIIDKQVILPGVTHREERRLESIRDYVQQQTGEECTLPQHIINDVYSMYVNEDFKRRDTNSGNAVKQKIIDRVYNSLTKEVTKNSALFSQLVTKELAIYMQKVEQQIREEMEQNQPGDGDGDGDEGGTGFDTPIPSAGGQGDEDGDGEDGEGLASGKAPGDGTEGEGTGDLTPEDQSKMDSIDDILDKNEKNLDKAMQKAADKMSDLEEKLGKEVLEDLSKSEPDFMEKMDGIKEELSRISISKESIKEVLSKILNKSENYFSKKFHTVEESIFDSEDFDDMFGLEFLNPIFKNAEILNIGNETRKYEGKIDLYLDCSGSMSSRETFEGVTLRMSDLVKGIAMVLFRMGMIDKLYFFDNSIYEIKRINEFTILGFNRSGGTNFNRVVDQCITNGRNSVVITDGEDSCERYIDNVFWVGVGGTQFTGWGGAGAFEEYRKKKQCVTYQSKGRSGSFVYV